MRKPAPPPPSRSIAAPLILLLAATTISLAAGILTLRFYQTLPNQAYRTAALEGVLRDAEHGLREGASPEALDGLLFLDAALTITKSLRADRMPEKAIENVQTSAASARTSALGRVQQAALRMRALEFADTPIERWWPALKPYLEGLDAADFAHRQHELSDTIAARYEAHGVPAGTARTLASRWEEHGPFLQFVTSRMLTMTDERERAGDVAAARTCRGILLRLMRQWTLDAGLPGTRLTAAELLARTIDQLIAVESSRPQSQPSTHAAERIFGIDSPTIMSTQLRKWREAYKTFAHAHPSPQLMNFADVPDFAPEEHARLQTTVFITSWFAAAAAFAAIVALALAWPLVRRGPTLARCLRMWILAGIAAAVTLIAAPLVAACAPAMISEQLRDLQMVRDAERIADVWSQRRYVPWYPFVAALLIAAPLLAALAVRPRITAPNALGSALARVGAVAAQTWLLLSVCLLIAALCGQGRREEYERAVADGYRRGVIETVVGPDTDCLLAPLRDWKP